MQELKVLGTEHIGKLEFTGIEGGFGKDKKAMLVKDIAQIHNQPLGEINRRINDNRKRFKDNLDLIDLKKLNGFEPSSFGFNKQSFANSNNIYLLSERGYAKLLKILDDDKAWDIYDQLVDNYFNMRVAIKNDEPSLVQQRRLSIMEDNAATRKARTLLKIADEVNSDTTKQILLAQAAKVLTGEMTLPTMKQKEYSAGQIAAKLGVSANMVGRTANKLGLKAEQPGQNQYGRWAASKSMNSDKEVPQWLYTDKGMAEIKKELA
ncbi:ORF6N domain-containing protein [Lactobacillus sp. ESL0679]|uniref:ORF6N domain-containing protein n=1 Tax=Lactobacillus sp. ESL0679 TaxID=2983209 RepID=UPI0023F8FAB2|nr:ORF6N domain-containing protein [Lactobacillus sp. ESL0679]MDF7683371.1 ORF6N domain-containing protein [Lactobacillus sp. ESL0679]